MARSTRQQRRARRARSASSLAEQSRAARQARSLQPQVAQPTRRQESARGGMGAFYRSPFNFIRESAGELKKVDWPGRQQLIQGTIVVILACAIVGGYLFVCDITLKRFVQNILLGQ
jgi:preprotein translocase subunit SecE